MPRQRSRILARLLSLKPQLAEAYNNRGIIARTLGDYRQASKDFERAAQLGMELAQQHLQVLREETRQVQDVCAVPYILQALPMAYLGHRRSSSAAISDSPWVTHYWTPG